VIGAGLPPLAGAPARRRGLAVSQCDDVHARS